MANLSTIGSATSGLYLCSWGYVSPSQSDSGLYEIRGGILVCGQGYCTAAHIRHAAPQRARVERHSPSSQGSPTRAALVVGGGLFFLMAVPSLSYLGNGWRNCAKIWCVIKDQLPKCFTQVKGGVHLHVCTCVPLFRISGTTGRIALKFGVWLEDH